MQRRTNRKMSKFTIISKTEDLAARVKELTGGVGVSRFQIKKHLDTIEHLKNTID